MAFTGEVCGRFSTVAVPTQCHGIVSPGCHRLEPVPFVSVWRLRRHFSLRQTTQLAKAIPNVVRTFESFGSPATTLHSTRGRETNRGRSLMAGHSLCVDSCKRDAASRMS